MAHKKEYTVNGDKVSKYNKEYYQRNRDKILKRMNKRVKDNPNINKDYYKIHKKKKEV